MSQIAIDLLTREFYDTISFKNGITPDITTLNTIFHGAGLMINNSFDQTLLFTAESFLQDLEAKVATDEIPQFIQREIYAKTEIFGKVAQRLSVYEYSFADYKPGIMPRGINFIQYVKIGEQWNITSMVWSDENENHLIPEAYLP